MKNSEYYKNEYPLEPLTKCPDEKEIMDVVVKSDYRIEADMIAVNDNMDKVNCADAVVFWRMGFEACQEMIEKKLIACDILQA